MIKRIGVFQSGELLEEQRRAQCLSYFESREPGEITHQKSRVSLTGVIAGYYRRNPR